MGFLGFLLQPGPRVLVVLLCHSLGGQHEGAPGRHMPPKAQQAADKPYRGGRAGAKQRKRHFYNAQDRIIEEGRRLFGVRVGRVEFENTSDAHFELTLSFADAENVGRYSEIWAEVVEFSPELQRAVSEAAGLDEEEGAPNLEGAAAASGSRGPKATSKWQPKAKAKQTAKAGCWRG